MITLLWTLAIIAFILFCKWIIPRIMQKIVFWRLHRAMRKMANKKGRDPETAKSLHEIADGLKQIFKDIEL